MCDTCGRCVINIWCMHVTCSSMHVVAHVGDFPSIACTCTLPKLDDMFESHVLCLGGAVQLLAISQQLSLWSSVNTSRQR